MPKTITIKLVAYFVETLGFEIYLNPLNNEAFMSLASYSRLSGVSYSTIKSRFSYKSSTSVDSETPGMTEDNVDGFDFQINSETLAMVSFESSLTPETDVIRYIVSTSKGDQEIQAIGEDLFLKWIAKDVPDLLLKIAKAGTRLFLYGLAGISGIPEAPSKEQTKRTIEQGYLSAIKSLDEEILKSDANTSKLKERRLKLELKFSNAIIEQDLDHRYLKSTPEDTLIDPVQQIVFNKIIKLAKKRDGVLPLSVICNQTWKKDPKIVQAFNYTRKYTNSLGQKEMIKACEQAQLAGFGIWNPNNKTFTIKMA